MYIYNKPFHISTKQYQKLFKTSLTVRKSANPQYVAGKIHPAKKCLFTLPSAFLWD